MGTVVTWTTTVPAGAEVGIPRPETSGQLDTGVTVRIGVSTASAIRPDEPARAGHFPDQRRREEVALVNDERDAAIQLRICRVVCRCDGYDIVSGETLRHAGHGFSVQKVLTPVASRREEWIAIVGECPAAPQQLEDLVGRRLSVVVDVGSVSESQDEHTRGLQRLAVAVLGVGEFVDCVPLLLHGGVPRERVADDVPMWEVLARRTSGLRRGSLSPRRPISPEARRALGCLGTAAWL